MPLRRRERKLTLAEITRVQEAWEQGSALWPVTFNAKRTVSHPGAKKGPDSEAQGSHRPREATPAVLQGNPPRETPNGLCGLPCPEGGEELGRVRSSARGPAGCQSCLWSFRSAKVRCVSSERLHTGEGK